MIIPLLENVVRKIRRALYIRTPDPVREQMRIGRLTFNYDLLWQDVPTRNKHLKSTGMARRTCGGRSGFAIETEPAPAADIRYWLLLPPEFVTLNGYPGGPFT